MLVTTNAQEDMELPSNSVAVEMERNYDIELLEELFVERQSDRLAWCCDDQ